MTLKSRKPSVSLIRAEVGRKLDELRPYLLAMAKATNPQEVECRNFTSGQISALESIKDMIDFKRKSLI